MDITYSPLENHPSVRTICLLPKQPPVPTWHPRLLFNHRGAWVWGLRSLGRDPWSESQAVHPYRPGLCLQALVT